MKGLIAPLLVTMMTGMVFCQQPQSDSFGSGNQAESNQTRLLGRYLLIMNRDLVKGLKSQGYLQAEIPLAKRNTIDHIVFHANVHNGDNKTLSPKPIMQQTMSGKTDRLEFVLNDDLIQLMRKDGLQYIIEPSEIGKYKEVLVIYDNPKSPTKLNGGNDSVAQNPSPSAEQNLIQNSFLNRGKEESNRKVFDQATNNLQNSTKISPSFTPRLGSMPEKRVLKNRLNSGLLPQDKTVVLNSDRFDPVVRNQRERSLDLNTDPGENRAMGNSRSFGQQSLENPIRQNNLADSRLPMDSDFSQAMRQRKLKDLERARIQQEQLLAENESLKQRLKDEQWIRDQRERELGSEQRARMAAERDLRIEREERLDGVYAQDTRRTPIAFPTNRYPNRYQSDYSDELITQQREQYANVSMPHRTAAKPQPTGRAPELQINGPRTKPGNVNDADGQVGRDQDLLADARSLERNNQVLWFIMLCSVGLNFYLALISRSFYVRYEELADELRDTFSSTTP